MTILVDGGHVPLVAANALAVSICGLVNFMLSDRLVFLR
jgi:putative flippase GtrA